MAYRFWTNGPCFHFIGGNMARNGLRLWTFLGGPLAANGSINFAASEAHRNIIAGRDLIRRAQDFPRSVVSDGVATLEQLEWAALLELQRGGRKPAALGDERSIHTGAQIAAALVEGTPQLTDPRPKIERREPHARDREPALLARDHSFERGTKSFALLLDAPPQYGRARAQVKRQNLRARFRHPLAGRGESKAQDDP